MSKLICGIDPGDYGALAFYDPENGMRVFDMPIIKITKTRAELDIPGFVELLREMKPEKIFTEFIHSMPFGANANYKRGGYAYAVRMFCAVMQVSLEEILPKAWQSSFGIKNTDASTTKNQAYAVASRLFPHIEFKTARGKLLDGRADAVLICEYGKRRMSDGLR